MSPERKSPFIFRFFKEGLKLSLFGLAGALLGTGIGALGTILGSSFFASTLTPSLFLMKAPLATMIGGTAGVIGAAASGSK